MKSSNVVRLEKLEGRNEGKVNALSVLDLPAELLQILVEQVGEREAIIFFCSLIDKNWRESVGPDPFILEQLRGKLEDEFIQRCYSHMRNYAFRDEISKEVRFRDGVLLDSGETAPG